MQFSPSPPSSVIDDAFSLIWPYHDHVQTFKGSKSWYEVVQFFFLFLGIFFHQILASISLKEQTERDKCGRISYGMVMIISKLHRDVSAHYPPRTGIQSRRRHLVETLLYGPWTFSRPLGLLLPIGTSKREPWERGWVPYIFPMVLIGKICLTNNTLFTWRSFPLFLSPVMLA